MDKLNQYLQELMSKCGYELHLEPNKNPYVVTSKGSTDVANTPLPGTQINSMIFSLIPADVKQQLPSNSQVEFVHPHNLGDFTFLVQKSPSGFNVTVSPTLSNGSSTTSEEKTAETPNPVAQELDQRIAEPKVEANAPWDAANSEVPSGLEVEDLGEPTVSIDSAQVIQDFNQTPETTVQNNEPEELVIEHNSPPQEKTDFSVPAEKEELLQDYAASINELESLNEIEVEYVDETPSIQENFTENIATPEANDTQVPQYEIEQTFDIQSEFNQEQSPTDVQFDTNQHNFASNIEIEEDMPNNFTPNASPPIKNQPVANVTTAGFEASTPQVEPPQAVPPVMPSPQPVAEAPQVSAPATVAPNPQAKAKMDALFHKMNQVGASDLHLSVSVPPMVRKDGRMATLDPSQPALTPETMKELLQSIMPQKNIEEFAERNDTDFAYEIKGLARFRANIFMDRKGMGGVFRIIPSDIMTAEDLNLSKHIMDLCELSKGLVVVTGPTGSGKSTTLCAMIDSINKNREDHIITIEDPIEFTHENKKCLVNQREVHNHTSSFKDALRAALREDPDILLVGEMRDLETISIAIETAETGHLVFGTLHTTTAASTIDRIIDQFPADRQEQIRVMLSESLRGVIAQTLLPRIGGGRIAALEVLIVTPAISNLIREGKTFQIPSAMQTGKNKGMVMLNDALMELVNKGLVEAKDAYIKAVDKDGFELLLKRSGKRI